MLFFNVITLALAALPSLVSAVPEPGPGSSHDEITAAIEARDVNDPELAKRTLFLCRNWNKIADCYVSGGYTTLFCECKRPSQREVCPKLFYWHGCRPSIPGGGSACKDPRILAWYWSRGYAVNRNCNSPGAPRPPFKPSVPAVPVVPAVSAARRDTSAFTCGPKERACRIDSALAGWDGEYECIDTTSNIDSCGGCMGEGGVDCASIEGVNGVACVNSKCAVSECLRGFKVAADGTTCERAGPARL